DSRNPTLSRPINEMTQTKSRILAWLRDCASSSRGTAEERRFIDLVSIIDDPEAVPPSKQYTFYSDQITRVMSKMGTETEAWQFVLDTYVLSQTNSVPAVASYYPALREFVKHYRKTPELLIVLYSL